MYDNFFLFLSSELWISDLKRIRCQVFSGEPRVVFVIYEGGSVDDYPVQRSMDKTVTLSLSAFMQFSSFISEKETTLMAARTSSD